MGVKKCDSIEIMYILGPESVVSSKAKGDLWDSFYLYFYPQLFLKVDIHLTYYPNILVFVISTFTKLTMKEFDSMKKKYQMDDWGVSTSSLCTNCCFAVDEK
ncbi:hypothetical protein C0R09_08940 [Brevibacillus laterosporus]|nr:hypothetical protein C0R09_08940 [Brevibacillus laterosporus]